MTTHPSIAILAAAAWLHACSGGASSGFVGTKRDADKEEDEETADPPTEISGSFLTGLNCAYLNAAPAAGEARFVGCGVYDGEQKLDDDHRTFALTLHGKDESNADLRTSPAKAASPWHVLARLPPTVPLDGYLRMHVRETSGVETAHDLPVAKIKAWDGDATLGKAKSDSKEDSPSGQKAMELKAFEFHARWAGGPLGFIADGITPAEFCSPEGDIRTSLSPASQNAIAVFGGAVPTEIKHGKGEIKLEDSVCFKDFSLLTFAAGGGDAMAHDGANGRCFFLRTRDDVLLIVDKSRSSADVTLKSLRELAMAKACP